MKRIFNSIGWAVLVIFVVLLIGNRSKQQFQDYLGMPDWDRGIYKENNFLVFSIFSGYVTRDGVPYKEFTWAGHSTFSS